MDTASMAATPADQLLWACSFGAMVALTAAISLLSFFPLQSAPLAQRTTPPELVAYLFFGCAFVLYTLAVMDPFPITLWVPLIAAIIVCAVLVNFGSRLSRDEPLVRDAIVQASTPARVATAIGVLLAGAFYARISAQASPGGVITWVPLLIVGYLISLAGNFVGRLLQDPSRKGLMSRQQVLIVSGALGAYTWWQFGSLSGEHLLDWRHYGIAVFVLTLGAAGGAIFATNTRASVRPAPPAVRNPRRTAVVTSSQWQSESATGSASSVGRIAGDAKQRHFGGAASPTRLLDHFDGDDTTLHRRATGTSATTQPSVLQTAKEPSATKSAANVATTITTTTTSAEIHETSEILSLSTAHSPTTSAAAQCELDTQSKKDDVTSPKEVPVVDLPPQHHDDTPHTSGPAASTQPEADDRVVSKIDEAESADHKPSDEKAEKHTVPAPRPTSAGANSERPTSASSSKGKSKSKRRGHKPNNLSGEHH